MNPSPRGTLARILWWALLVLLVVYVVRHPTSAAGGAQTLAGWLARAADAVATFLQHSGGGR